MEARKKELDKKINDLKTIKKKNGKQMASLEEKLLKISFKISPAAYYKAQVRVAASLGQIKKRLASE